MGWGGGVSHGVPPSGLGLGSALTVQPGLLCHGYVTPRQVFSPLHASGQLGDFTFKLPGLCEQ